MIFRCLILGDIHEPWGNRAALRVVYKIAKEFNPTHIVQIGDLYDMYSFSRFPRSLNLLTPKQEMEQGYANAYQMWLTLKTLCPRAKKFQLKGNHCERLNKKLITYLPEAESLVNFGDLFSFPKVETLASERDELILNDICFMHGFRTKLGDHAKHNGLSTVCGHSHTGGVVFSRLGNKIIWELNAGFLADENSAPLSYTRQRRISKWTLGVGLIDELGPRFVPI